MRYLLLLFSIFIVSCSSGGWLIDAELADQADSKANRSPASQQPTYASVAPTVGNPCSGMRFLKTASTNAKIYRCTVVLNPQMNMDAKLQLQEADICLSFYTIPDDRNNPAAAFQLNGLLLSMKDTASSKTIKNLLIRSSRVAGEPVEKSNHLDYITKKSSTEISDLIPLSGGIQKINFDQDKKTLTYETFETENLSFLPILKSPAYSISAKFQCSDDIVYHDPSQLGLNEH